LVALLDGGSCQPLLNDKGEATWLPLCSSQHQPQSQLDLKLP
jgi:hypothetical protein